MINASKEFKEKLKKGANMVNYADFTLSDGTVLHLEPKDFMISGCTVEDKTTDGKFGVGFVIGKTCTLRIANHDERFSQYDFYNSIINLYVALALDNGTVEKIRKGIYYTLVPETPGDVIEISAVDGMYQLDRDYADSTTAFPATLQTIISQACTDCGIPIGFRQFDNMSFVVQTKPENVTYRQVLSYACQIAGYNARIDNDGYMQLVWYNTSMLDWYNYDGGDFKTYPHDTILDGGDFTNYGQGTRIDAGLFTDEIPEHIFRIKNLTVSTDDVQITGVKIIGENDNAALFGEEGYIIEVKNPFAVGKESEVANYLGNRMVGMMFRPFNADVLNNPLYEPFDVVRVSDRKGNVYVSIINAISYKIGGFTTVSCQAEDPVRNGTTYFSDAAQAVAEARRNTQKQITEYDKAVQDMNQLAANAMGLFRAEELQPNGSHISYESDRPITVDENGKCHFEEGSHVWMKSDAGFFVSEDGGKTYTAGFDKNNNAVLNVLYAIGIVADWIRSGRFEVRKGNKVTFLADADTGEVRIVADSFSLSSGDTIESIAQGKVDGQTQLDIFDKLTNDGVDQCIKIDDNTGHLYINGEFVQAKGLRVKNKNNVQTFYVDNDGNVQINANSLSIGGTNVATQEYVRSKIDGLEENMLKGSLGLKDEYWYFDASSIERNVQDPAGGTNAVGVTSNDGGDVIIEAKSTNKPYASKNTSYRLTVWAKSGSDSDIIIQCGGVVHQEKCTLNWKMYSVLVPVTTDGGLSTTISFSDTEAVGMIGAYVYNPTIMPSYTTEEIFNILTDNGKIQGLYSVGGNYYFSGKYIQTEGLKAMTGTGANRKTTFEVTSDGKVFVDGVFSTTEPFGSTYKKTEIKEGVISGYIGATKSGLLDLSAKYTDNKRDVSLNGFDTLHLQSGSNITLEIAQFNSNGALEIVSNPMTIQTDKVNINKSIDFYGDANFKSTANFNYIANFKDTTNFESGVYLKNTVHFEKNLYSGGELGLSRNVIIPVNQSVNRTMTFKNGILVNVQN